MFYYLMFSSRSLFLNKNKLWHRYIHYYHTEQEENLFLFVQSGKTRKITHTCWLGIKPRKHLPNRFVDDSYINDRGIILFDHRKIHNIKGATPQRQQN